MTMFDLSRFSLPNNKERERERERERGREEVRKIGRVRERERAVGVACDMYSVCVCGRLKTSFKQTHS